MAERRGYGTTTDSTTWTWVDSTLEVESGGLHVIADRAQAFVPGRGGSGLLASLCVRGAGGRGVGAAEAPLSEAQVRAGARLAAISWIRRRTPTAGVACRDPQTQLAEELAAEALGGPTDAELDRRRAEVRRRAEASRRRVERGGR